jgi:RHS repeat-associated protein
MLDTQGKIAGTALYSPYGKLLQSQGVQANIAYAGLYNHKETGLYLATYRGYNPFTARWLNRDPIEENGGLNLYEYVGGNPISYVDFLGLYEIIFGSKGTSSNAVYDQKVTVFDGSVELGKFDGSSTPNPYKPSNPSLRGTNAYPQIQGGTYGVNHGTHRGEPALVVNNNSNVPTTTINPNFPEQGAYATFIHIHKGFSPSWKGSAGCPTIEPSQWSDFINAIPNGDGKVMLP